MASQPRTFPAHDGRGAKEGSYARNAVIAHYIAEQKLYLSVDSLLMFTRVAAEICRTLDPSDARRSWDSEASRNYDQTQQSIPASRVMILALGHWIVE